MRTIHWRAVLLLAVTTGLMVPNLARLSWADEKAGDAAAETKKDKAEAKAEGKAGKGKGARKEAAGRLPAFYADIVDGEQRTKIYAIQAEHDPAIRQLQASLKEAIAKRDAAVLAVLTPAQQEKLAKLEAEAKEKRAAKMAKPAADEKNATASADGGKSVKKDGDADAPKAEKAK